MGKTKSFRVTPKHRRFVQYYIKTGNASESGKLAGFTAQYGTMLLHESMIIDLIEGAQLKAGLTDEFLLRTHMELLTKGDHNIKTQNLRLAYQVKKKIGSDDAPPPPAVLPAVVIQLGGKGGATATITGAGAVTGGERQLSAHRPAGVGIQRPNKP